MKTLHFIDCEKRKDYEGMANEFLNITKSDITKEFLKNDYHFDGDNAKRDIYKVTIKRGKRSFTFNFGQSINDSQHYFDYKTPSKKRISEERARRIFSTFELKRAFVKGKVPDNYSILACLQKHEVGTFEDFCIEFGYDTDSKKAEKIYKAVKSEFDNVCKLYNDKEIELLQEIN